MCYFRWAPLLSDDVVEIKDAVVAWKSLRLRSTGSLMSPVQSTLWTPERPTYAKRAPTLDSNIGIYCYDDSRAARSHESHRGQVVVKLLLWGKVLHFGGTENGLRKPGYRAQRAEIHEIHLPARLLLTSGVHGSGAATEEAVRLLVERWRGHGVKIVRSLPEKKRVTLLTGSEQMPVAVAA